MVKFWSVEVRVVGFMEVRFVEVRFVKVRFVGFVEFRFVEVRIVEVGFTIPPFRGMYSTPTNVVKIPFIFTLHHSVKVWILSHIVVAVFEFLNLFTE